MGWCWQANLLKGLIKKTSVEYQLMPSSHTLWNLAKNLHERQKQAQIETLCSIVTCVWRVFKTFKTRQGKKWVEITCLTRQVFMWTGLQAKWEKFGNPSLLATLALAAYWKNTCILMSPPQHTPSTNIGLFPLIHTHFLSSPVPCCVWPTAWVLRTHLSSTYLIIEKKLSWRRQPSLGTKLIS